MEIAAALDNGLPIIPVLVNGASMPTASELPDDLKDFSYRNALTIDRGRNFHRDADDLVREIEALAPRAWRRRAVAALVAVAAALLVGWLAVPNSAWHGLLRMVSAPVSDVEVASFRTPEGRPEFEFLRQKVERNFVDLFSDAKLRVRSALTTNQSLAQAHFTLAGGIVEQGGQVMVTAELRDAGGVVVASSQIEGALDELEGIYKVIPEALMYGMAVDTPTLSRNRRASRPTSSVEALAYFLQARREVQARDFQAAEWSLRHAFAIDPAFAMAYWAVGEVKRLQGDPAQAGEWYAKASAQNKDHPRWSIEPAREAQPVPALLAQLRAAEPDELLPGAGYSVVRLPDYDLNLHVWSFDPKRFQLKLRQQVNAGGQSIGEFMTDPGDVLAINGGFFDTDSRRAPHAERAAHRRRDDHSRRHREGLRHPVRHGGRRRDRPPPGFPRRRRRPCGAERAVAGRSRRQARDLQGGFRPSAAQCGLSRRRRDAHRDGGGRPEPAGARPRALDAARRRRPGLRCRAQSRRRPVERRRWSRPAAARWHSSAAGAFRTRWWCRGGRAPRSAGRFAAGPRSAAKALLAVRHGTLDKVCARPIIPGKSDCKGQPRGTP